LLGALGASIRRWGSGMIILFVLLTVLAIQTSTLPSEVRPRVVADLEGYSEGIVFDGEGTGYVSLLHRQGVYRVPAKDRPAKWYGVAEPNGHKILKDGSHLVAARGGIHHITPDGRLLQILAPTVPTPNDLALDGDGGFYVSAPAPSEKDQQAKRSSVYYLGLKRPSQPVADGLCYPNGIVVRPDGRALLVNDSCTRQIFEYQITGPGTVTNRRVFAELPDSNAVPDGMTIDQSGRVWVADYGTGVVAVFDARGTVLRQLATGLQHASNVAFGGSSLQELYVTGSPGAEEGTGRLVVLLVGVTGRDTRSTPASITGR
jgi:sugar lactone lactonase YvrE